MLFTIRAYSKQNIKNLLGSRDSFIPHSRVQSNVVSAWTQLSGWIEISSLLNRNKKSKIFFALGLNLSIYYGH